ncbi:hypothetical protein FKP32DRAFT_1678183 [Trametes sanguinea]|nr:hypothetical protein FKP32DRAFT_1678183 [Trametes sanguinea]
MTFCGIWDEDESSRQQSPHAAVMLFDSIVRSATHLRHLRLYNPVPLSSSSLRALANCNNLESLILSKDIAVDAPAVRALSSIGTLRSVTMTLLLNASEPVSVSLGFAAGFRNCDRLSLRGNIRDLDRFIEAMDTAMLRALRLIVSEAAAAEDLEKTLAQITRRMPRELQSFAISASHHSLTAGPVAFLDLLEPLLSLNNLVWVECKLTTVSPPHLSDGDITRLAKAWPRIQRLDISFCALDDFAEHQDVLGTVLRVPTFQSLCSFAEHCVRLQTVRLPYINLSKLPSKEAVPVRESLIECFEIGGYLPGFEVKAAMPLAILLDRQFPLLKTFNFFFFGGTF